jgi:hypothetical protein
VRGLPDSLSWKVLPLSSKVTSELSVTERALRRITSIKAEDATPFARFFPEFSVLQVRREGERTELYSLVHNHEHSNVSWMLSEEEPRTARRHPDRTRRHPRRVSKCFFIVPRSGRGAFGDAVVSIKSTTDYERLVDGFGSQRSNEKFWSVFDNVNKAYLADDPVRSGTLDLTRYSLEQK